MEERLKINRQLLSYRQTAEWGNRALQGSFGRLRIPLEAKHKDDRADLLEICLRLHNLRCRWVGFNQIQSVYDKQCDGNPDELHIWQQFEDILFSEQRRMDRVSRFHIVAEYYE
jgi:hypothetical protein